jgi:hypothetical protein
MAPQNTAGSMNFDQFQKQWGGMNQRQKDTAFLTGKMAPAGGSK